MYTLYLSPGTCSLATHVLMNELNLTVHLIEKSKVDKFENINPADTVPVLGFDKTLIQEGAAMALFLMEKHKSNLLLDAAESRSTAIQWMMFANASADIMLSVYANWNNYFPEKIQFEGSSRRMIKEVSSRDAFKKSIQTEKIKFSVQ